MAFPQTAAAAAALLVLANAAAYCLANDPSPTPAPWPHQFHSILFLNVSGALSLVDLWYDWPNGRNFDIIQYQLGGAPLYDLEWNNGTSFYYTLEEPRRCRTAQFEVGILPPNWLDGANYLGQEYVDGFLCNSWEKVEFLWYYEDVVTKRPVRWVFYTGNSAHVMTFDVGAALEDEKWQAPSYCFVGKEEELSSNSKSPSFIKKDSFISSIRKRAFTGSLGL